jgi:hypothetical protein
MFTREGFLGAASSTRGRVNTMTLGVAFVMSIMVINNYRQCEEGKGYPEPRTFVNMSYALAIIILIACCLLLGYDLAVMAKIV